MISSKKLRLLFTFYSSFFAAAFIITLICLYLLMELGSSALMMVIWFKFITMGIIAYYINSYKKKDFLYYQNLGISKTMLWRATQLMEILIFIISIGITSNFI